LFGGDPGIGKSTLLLQAAAALARAGNRVLYVSSEESAEQVKLRAARLLASAQSDEARGGVAELEGEGEGNGITSDPRVAKNLYLLSDTSLARIAEQAAKTLGELPSNKRVLIIDSIQMIYKADLDAFPGSMTQLRRCCAELVYMAKATGTAVLLIGHVTKDGNLAGPRLLEHLVDAVLYFEGDRYHAHRVVRAVKNRFGSTLELGLFEMTGRGLVQAPDGAVASLTQPARPGTVVCPVQTGSRCLLVELQALTATSFPGAAKRKSSGVDASRLAMIIAVLEQHAGLRLADRDVFASSVGGVKVVEPAADLAVLLAIAGAHYRRSLPARCAVIGEVGLGGEVRGAPQLDTRIHEAVRLGCTSIVLPASQMKAAKASLGIARGGEGVRLVPVANVDQAIAQLEVVPGSKAAATEGGAAVTSRAGGQASAQSSSQAGGQSSGQGPRAGRSTT